MGNNEDIIQILRVLQAVNKINSNTKKESPLEEAPDAAMRSLKAAALYLPLEHQKNIFIAVKMMEISKMLQNYRKMLSENITYEADLRQALFAALREQATPEQKNMIDALMKFSQINKIMEVKKNEK